MFKFNKKGFGSIISSLIMFIAIISVSTVVVISFKNQVFQTNDAINQQNDFINQKIKTNIAVSNIYYNSSSEKVYIYVKNLGETDLHTKLFDLYIDKQYLSNFSKKEANNPSLDLKTLSPQKTMLLIVDKKLNPGSHSLTLVTQYANREKAYFNI